jgi:acetyl esterase
VAALSAGRPDAAGELPAYPEEVAAVRRERSAQGRPPVFELSVEEARRLDLEEIQDEAGPVEPVARVEELEYEGPAEPLRARLYAPEAQRPPLFVYFHGGGWVLGELDLVDGIARALANAAGIAVLSCEYRRPPEHPFPAAVEDAEAAVRWGAANAEELGVDGGRLAVGGDSAGGNLAAVVTQRLRDSGGPALAFQLLIYPVTQHGADTRSSRAVVDTVFLTTRSMTWYWDHYLPDPDLGRDPRASPLLAESFEGLPPALVITAEHDPLLDEGEQYARRLADAGVAVKLSRYAGMPHGFFRMTGELSAARDAQAESAAALRNALQARR